MTSACVHVRVYVFVRDIVQAVVGKRSYALRVIWVCNHTSFVRTQILRYLNNAK